MALRLLDRGARYDRQIKAQPISKKPYATEWVNMLGDLLFKRREEASPIIYDLDRKALELADKMEPDYPDVAQVLRNIETQPHPVWRLAESLTSLRPQKTLRATSLSTLDSALLVGRPNGLALKRTVTRNLGFPAGRKRSEIRSLVITDSVLDYLSTCMLCQAATRAAIVRFSFKDFIQILKTRYGFCIDTGPLGMTISNELLRRNRCYYRRLRDLGLLVGVNDAEAMKCFAAPLRAPNGG